MDTLHDCLTAWMDQITPEKKKEYVVKVSENKELYNVFNSAEVEYVISPAKGQGNNYPIISYLAIMNKKETTSPQSGYYIVYLLSEDSSALYLTLNFGISKIKAMEGKTKRETISIISREYQQLISTKTYERGTIDLVTNNKAGKEYETSTIFFKKYDVNNVPSNEQLIADLEEVKQMYLELLSVKNGDKDKGAEVNSKLNLANQSESIRMIELFITSKGFVYDSELIKNYYLCLKTKPFVILAGISGTGKTRLVRLFAEAICDSLEDQYKLVPVRPDWSDPSDLLGHLDLEGKFQPGPVLDFIDKASKNLDKPYFLCLDEMNLARVEYYFSDFLSVMETRERKGQAIQTSYLVDDTYFGKDNVARNRYGGLYIPENLYIIGTVNMDETTFPFSKKVLDRANTIEISSIELKQQVLDLKSDKCCKNNDFLKSEYIILRDVKGEQTDNYIDILESINKELKRCNSEIGYRVRDEFIFYNVYNSRFKMMEEDNAIDYAIMQKILPRIHGSSMSVKEALFGLFRICYGKSVDFSLSDDVGMKMEKTIMSSNIKYKNSASKIAQMVRRFEEDGFTTFWV